MSVSVIVHVKSDVTGRLRCGLRSGVGRSPIVMSSTDYLLGLATALGEQIKLQFGETARICSRCWHAA